LGELFNPIHLLVLAVMGVFVVLPFWMIFKKAGFPPWISILVGIPFVGIIVLYVVAFSEWKVIPVLADAGTVPPYPPQS